MWHAVSMHAPSASSCDIGFRVGTVIGHDRNRWGRVAVGDSYLYCCVPSVPAYFYYMYIVRVINVRFELANLFSRCLGGIELYRPINGAQYNIIGT